jgi:hypothetical protein
MNLSRENQLLLYCAQLELTENMRSDLAKLVGKPIEWNAFLDSARWHGVAPLAFNNLKNIPERQQIPAEIIENLKSDYRKNLVRNTIIFAELDRILATFEKQRIQVIPIKGAAFARKIYGDIGLRPMSDIDILVKRADVYHAENVVHELGYLQDGKIHNHIKYINADDNFHLEIHWAVSNPHHPTALRVVDSKLVDIWWRRALPYSSEFQNILSLNPADRIYLLASHFFKHRFIRPNKVFNSCGALIQLCDIYNVTNYYKNDIDWEKLKIESRQIGLYKIVSVTLSIVKEIFDLQNDHTMDFLNDWKFGGLDQEIINHVTKRLFMREDKLAPVPFAFINAQTEISFQRRFKRIFKEIFPNPEALSRKLKRPIRSKAFYLIYLTRPFILLTRYGKSFFERRRLKEEGILKRWIDAQD